MLKKYRYTIVLFTLALVIHIWSYNHQWVERFYSKGLYVVISKLQRFLFGWIPFSLGDIIYIALILFLLYKVYKFFKNPRRPSFKNIVKHYTISIFHWILYLYISFNLLWGLNYNRTTVAEQYQLTTTALTVEDLSRFMQVVIQRLDALGDRNDFDVVENTHIYLKQSAKAIVSRYDSDYRFASIKSSLFGVLGNYLGYSGYYNPITGEAQVNMKIPAFTIPFTATHEIGHQLGYAKESEANFIGFLAASKSEEKAFRYSAYLDAYLYANFFMEVMNPELAQQFYRQLPVWVQEDIRWLKQFWRQYRNPVDRLINVLYGQFLKANQQPEGMLSYNGLVNWLIAYAEKYGWEKL